MAPSDLRRGYDAVVIGAGIAGMMAASELNQRGLRALVLEHNHQAGGLMAGIRRKGFYFDVGCQSFENMGIVFPLLEQYGIAPFLKFHRTRYRLKMPDIDTVVMSLKQAREDFKKAYPGLAAGFDRVFDAHDLTSALIRRAFTPESIPYVSSASPKQYAVFLGKMLPFLKELKTWMWEDFEDWYERLLPPSGVRDLLATCGYSRMNVFVASAFWHLWAEDYWYPDGGFGLMFETWVKILESRGVEFRFKQRAVALEKAGMEATAVLTSKGERFEARQIIYCGDYKKGAFELIGRERYAPAEIARLERARHSDPLASVYLGLNLPPEELKKIVKAAHVFYFPAYGCRTEMDLNDKEAHRKTFLEVSSHCIQDPALAPPGKSSVVLQAFTRCEWNDHWLSGGNWDERSLEYRALKRGIADELITVFEGIFPDVRKHIEYVDMGTPLTAHRFTRNELGGTCGFELNWRNYPFLNPLAHTKTPLENVRFAGHFTVWPGAVPTAALSGKIAAHRAALRLERSRGGGRAGVKEREGRVFHDQPR